MRIDPSQLAMNSLTNLSEKPAAKGTGANSFGQSLMNAIGEVNSAQQHAGELSTRFAAGENIDVHEVMIASQEAGVMLSLATQVRNKMVDGFQEIMRTNM